MYIRFCFLTVLKNFISLQLKKYIISYVVNTIYVIIYFYEYEIIK